MRRIDSVGSWVGFYKLVMWRNLWWPFEKSCLWRNLIYYLTVWLELQYCHFRLELLVVLTFVFISNPWPYVVILAGLARSSEFPTYSKRNSPNSVPQDSKFFLRCPMESQHASYVWHHQDRRRECLPSEQDCLLLIDSMSAKDEGVYKCVASENGYNRTIVVQELQMNGASETRMTHVALACLLLLIASHLLVNWTRSQSFLSTTPPTNPE